MIIIFILLLTWCGVKCNETSYYTTKLALKAEHRVCTESIAAHAKDFVSLIQDSKVFIDNTLILKELLEGDYSRTVLLCPSKWGRTTVMTMLKSFLQITVDSNGYPIENKKKSDTYRLFVNAQSRFSKYLHRLDEPLLISQQHDLVTLFQGEFPVVYVSFNDTIGENFTVVYEKIGLAISEVFKEHRFMVHALLQKRNPQVDRFREILHYNETVKDIEDWIPFLCRLLHEHFKKPVFLLIDDYDKPIHNYLQIDEFEKKDFKQILQLLENIMVKAFEPKYEIRNGIVMGTYEPGRSWNCTWKDYRKIYIGHDNTPLREFFGFNKKHLDYLYKSYKIPYKLSQTASRWYDGHESTYSGQHFYTSTSILKFLRSRKVQPYLIEQSDNNGTKHYIQRVIERDCLFSIRETMFSLISKQPLEIFDERLEMTSDIMIMLKGLLRNSPKYCAEGEIFFYSYLFREGLLTKIRNSELTNEDKFFSVLLVNNEAAFILADSLVSYYVQYFNIDTKFLNQVARTFHQFFADVSSTGTRKFENALTSIYNSTRARIGDEWLEPEEFDYAHSIFYCVTLRMQCLTKFQIEVFYNRTAEADIVLVDEENNQGMAIELTRGSSAETAYQSVQRYGEVFKRFVNVYKIKLVGINISSNKTVEISVKSIGKE